MAAALGPEETDVLNQLCTLFPELEKNQLHEIAAQENFDMKKFVKFMYGMVQSNKETNEPLPQTPENKEVSMKKTCFKIVDDIEKGYKVMVLMRGLPGSGKSHLATYLLEHSLLTFKRDEFVFSADDYPNKADEYICDSQELQAAHLWNQRRVFGNVRKGVSPIIIDSANLEISDMKVYCLMGVQNGYIIEIVEVATPWALNPEELSLKNNHGVDKKEISAMLKRYEQGVTVRQLLAKFELVYTVEMPQYREYPSFIVPFKTPKLPDVANSARKKELPNEYVHNFQNSRQSKKSTSSNAGSYQLLNTEKSTDNKNFDPTGKNKSTLKTQDLVQSRDEFQLSSSINTAIPSKKLTPKPIEMGQLIEIDVDSKQEDKEMMEKLEMTLQRDSNIQLPPPIVDANSLTGNDMEVDEPANLESVEAISETSLLGKTLNDSVRKTNNTFPTFGMKSFSTEDALTPKREISCAFRADGRDSTYMKKKTNTRASVLKLTKQFEKTSIASDKGHSPADTVCQFKNRKSEFSYSNVTNQLPYNTSDAAVAEKTSNIPNLIPQINDGIEITDDSSDDDNESHEEDMVEFTLSVEQVVQLQKMFGRLALGDNLRPIVQIPESFARQLHGAYLESVCRQIEDQSEYISRQKKEDEEFAKRLPEAQKQWLSENSMNDTGEKKDVDELNYMSPDTLAHELNKQKLYAAFPKVEKNALDVFLNACKNDYRETVKVFMATDLGKGTLINDEYLLEPPIPESTLTEMKMYTVALSAATDVGEDEADGNLKSARKYREEANIHMHRRQKLQCLAQNHYENGLYAVSMFYRQLAQKELKKAEIADIHATQSFIKENSENLKDTIDLHYLYSEAALNTLDMFIDVQISKLKDCNKVQKSCCVITGRGKRSKNGKSVIKPLVMRRLEQRKVHFTIINPGMLRIEINTDLPMTTDIQK